MSDAGGRGLVTLGVDNIIHENTGVTASGTSHVVSLAGSDSTTAGNTVVVVATTVGTGLNGPSGFAQAGSQASTLYVFYKPDVSAAETSWTFTTPVATPVTWDVFEVSNLDPALPVDVTVGNTQTLSNGGTASTGTTGVSIGLSTLALAAFAFQRPSTSDVVSWSGWTNGFTEAADVSPSGGTTATPLAVARYFENGSTHTFQTSATLATTSASSTAWGLMVVFHAADSPLVTQMAAICGFEWGTHAGMANGGGGPNNPQGGLLAPVGGTWGTNYLVQAASARSSGYGLRIVRSASACQVLVGSFSSAAAAFGFNVRVVSATGTATVAAIYSGGVTRAAVVYDASTTRFGVKAGSSGTVSWQSGTTALNTWVWLEVRARTNTSTHHAEWRLETGTDTYTDQPSADLTGQAAGLNAQGLALGGSGTDTATIDYDDVVISAQYATYPLGPHQVRLLTVDPAGTPTVSGTTTNFSTFASNGTLTAWNAVNARNAVDEVPPTISASADGVTQTATAATDYMEFPMATYTCAANEYIDGVRAVVPLWSGTGAGAGDLAIRGWEGTTETALAAASQITPGAPTAGSSTAPVWRQAMWPAANRWTQAKLDAAALRVGFSGDATPDMGVEAIYLEISVGVTAAQPLFGTLASVATDPGLAVTNVTMTAPDSGSASLYYETNATPTTVPVTAGTTTTQAVDAPDVTTTNYIAGYWPPEGVADA